MNILVSGASGYLGSAIHESLLIAGHSSVGTYLTREHSSLAPMDVTDERQVAELFNELRPDYVIHCVGLVDECSTDPEYALRVNEGGTTNVVRSAADHGAPLVFVSSAAVFDGKQGSFNESETTLPRSPYGRSKVACEEIVASSRNNLILRPSWFVDYAPHGMDRRGFGKILTALRGSNRVEMDDEWNFTPSSVRHISEVVKWWINKGEDRPGILHVASPEITTKYRLALQIARSMGLTDEKTAQLLGIKPQTGDAPLNLLDTTRLREMSAPKYSLGELLTAVRSIEGNKTKRAELIL